MERLPPAQTLWAYAWYAFVTLGAWIAFYKNYVEPSLKLIEHIGDPSIVKDTDKDRNLISILQFEVKLKEQRACEFVTWFGKHKMSNQSYSKDQGKTYIVNIPLRKLDHEFRTISIDAKRWWLMYWLSKKTVPVGPLIRIRKDYTQSP